MRTKPSSVPTRSSFRSGNSTALVTLSLLLGILTPFRSRKYDWLSRSSSMSPV